MSDANETGVPERIPETPSPFVPPGKTKDQLYAEARATAHRLATSWSPDEAAAVGLYDAPGAVVVFGHPPHGYYAVIWDVDTYQRKDSETRVGIWDGLTIVHGQA